MAMNYVIEYRDFLDRLAEVLRTPGSHDKVNDKDNCRGISLLTVFVKKFETTVNKRSFWKRIVPIYAFKLPLWPIC